MVTRRDTLVWFGGLGAGVVLGSARPVSAADGGNPHAQHQHQAHDHAAHMAQAAADKTRSVQSYTLPPVAVVDQRGRKVPFDKAMNDGRAVVLNFIFTTCTTICPVMTQIFTQVQDKLAGEKGRLHLVSVSIDPEHDTPARLAAYAKERGAGPQWDFYTGTREASIAVQQAFDAYRGDKMNHAPVTLLRGPRGATWTRLDGFATAETIVDVYRSLGG